MSAPDHLHALEAEAVHVFREVAAELERPVLLFSGGKDSIVLLRLAEKAFRPGRFPCPVLHVDTGVLHPETLETWRAFEERWGVGVEVVDAKADPPWTGNGHCCSNGAKRAALDQALDGAEAWITGLRREQAATRAAVEPLERDEAHGIWKVNPLADWTDKDVWAHIAQRDLPYNPLHDRGYASIGCAPCTQPGEGREGRWAGDDKTECGIHA